MHKHIISNVTISHCIISHHITSHHITSHHIKPHYAIHYTIHYTTLTDNLLQYKYNIIYYTTLLWPPYVIGQAIIFLPYLLFLA